MSEQNLKVVYEKLGGPDVVKAVAGPLPTPGAGQVRIRVEAAGAAYGDVLPRRGLSMPAARFPYTPGYDVVGRVDLLGPEVTTVSASGSHSTC